uniref:Uncharacterized protein n=1 Tax=Rhizophora mucronata TaxID=61149 RepID=A0A2P2P5D7_RHIMU
MIDVSFFVSCWWQMERTLPKWFSNAWIFMRMLQFLENLATIVSC